MKLEKCTHKVFYITETEFESIDKSHIELQSYISLSIQGFCLHINKKKSIVKLLLCLNLYGNQTLLYIQGRYLQS